MTVTLMHFLAILFPSASLLWPTAVEASLSESDTSATTFTSVVSNSHSNATVTLLERRQRQRRRKRQRRRQLNEISTHQIPTTTRTLTVPLFQSHNSYHANIYIGSPPQRRFVILDSGSRYLVFPCKPCRTCGKSHFSKEYFDPVVSTTDLSNRCNTDLKIDIKSPQDGENNGKMNECTFLNGNICDLQKEQCRFLQQYAEGSSTRGYEMEDIVWFGTDHEEESIKIHMQHAVPISFGCQTEETGMIANQYADGIFGLIEHEGNAMIQSMFEAGIVPHHAFSICLNATGGMLSLGGTGLSEQHLEPMMMQPRSTDSKFFSIDVDAMFLGEVEFVSREAVAAEFSPSSNKGRKGKGAVIDSGTTDSFLPQSFASAATDAWQKITGRQYTNEVETYLTLDEFRKLPALTVVLKSGYKWVIEPRRFMEEVRPTKGESKEQQQQQQQESSVSILDTIDIEKSENTVWPKHGVRFINRLYWDERDGAVFGSNAMLGHDILFDLENDMIGFAKANC